VLAFASMLLAVNLPFLLWAPEAFVYAYTEQGGRGITGESLPFIPLRALGLAHVEGEFWDPAVVPAWANVAAVVVQVSLVLGALALVARFAESVQVAVALAAIVPVVFLLSNRIFSPQFLVVLLAAWAVAGSLLARDRLDQLLFGAATGAASFANALVYPTQSQEWLELSAAMFVFAIAATAWVVLRATTDAAVATRA